MHFGGRELLPECYLYIIRNKTLNMDMLRVFFKKSEEDTSVYFRDKKVWACGKEYREYQGKYSVIYVTFKDVKCEDWETAYDLIYKILRNEFERHSELLNSDKISSYEKKYLTSMLDGEANENDVAFAFLNLSRILCVAKESIFSGLNNLKMNSILDNRYSEYFGFTSEEVQEMADYYGTPERYEELSVSGMTDIVSEKQKYLIRGLLSDILITSAFRVLLGSLSEAMIL